MYFLYSNLPHSHSPLNRGTIEIQKLLLSRFYFSLSRSRSASVASTHVSYTVVQEVKTLTFHLRTYCKHTTIIRGGWVFFVFFSFKSVAARSVVYVLHYYKRCKKKILLLPVITAGNVSARVQTNNTEFLSCSFFSLSHHQDDDDFFPAHLYKLKQTAFVVGGGKGGNQK